ncbi:hypothetical protein D4764_07G0008000 [Takifugu flavidus]|uniref:Uncharacterized protein n=1 Tax=Takifugu flavidus TaxID=433684 RepID=A0A5C6MVG1_9TELE|nr:hypothetical protein D4764_07G0008000 [Takifugu flavidus]
MSAGSDVISQPGITRVAFDGVGQEVNSVFTLNQRRRLCAALTQTDTSGICRPDHKVVCARHQATVLLGIMRDPFIPMQPGIVVMVAAHMMFNVQSQTEVTGFLGTNITLKFTFPADVSIQNNSHFVVHQNSKEQKKVAEYTQGNRGDVFEVHPENNSVLWHIIGVRLNDSGDYWASLVNKRVIKSNTVWVNVREAATNCIGNAINCECQRSLCGL